MFVLELLGTLSLRDDARPVPVSAQQKRPLGLLGILALGGRRGLSRNRIEAYLWPETASAPARHSLDQTVYAIRNSLGGESVLVSGRELRLNPDLLSVDVWAFDDAIRASHWATAVGCYQGPLLDGVHIADSRELESWIDTERIRVRVDYQTALESLAIQAAETGDHAQSVARRRRVASSDPLSADAAKKLMHALADSGDRAGAVKHARVYQELVRQELEIEPDSEIESLAAAFSHAASSEIPIAAARQAQPDFQLPPAPALPVAKARMGGDAEKFMGRFPLRNLSRMKHSRLAAVLSSSVLIVLLVGAVTVKTRHRVDLRPRVGESTSPGKSRVVPAAAHDSYVRGLNAWTDGSREGLDSAVQYFRRATELDPLYAEAYAGLANAYVMLGYFGYRPSEAMFPEAKRAAVRSVELDSTLASPHPALAYELAWERDFAGADAEFRKAVALDPTHATAKGKAVDPTFAMAHQWYEILLMILSERPQLIENRPEASRDAFAVNVPIVEIPFTKWVTAYPALAGFTGDGPGTIVGAVLHRIDDGTVTHLSARYEVTDPSGSHSFKAVIQGKADNKSGDYELNGIVTWGWMLGARVRASFVRVTPCQLGKLNVCFQGTIQIQRR